MNASGSWAATLAQRFGIRVEASYLGCRDGWYLYWSNGPTRTTMQAAAEEEAPKLAPLVSFGRTEHDNALAAQAVWPYDWH